MDSKIRKEIMNRYLTASSEEIAASVAAAAAQELGKLLVRRNNQRSVSRQIRRLGLWSKKVA